MRFSLILQGSLLASVTASLILFVKWLFREHMTAKWHYYIWTLLLLRLLVPATVEPVPNSSSIYNAVNVTQAAETVSRRVVRALEGAESAPVVVVPARENGKEYYQRVAIGETMPEWSHTLDITLFWIWAAAAALLLLYHFTLGLRLYIQARRYPRGTESLSVRARELLARVYGTEPEKESPVQVRIAPEGATPYVCGVFCPVLVIPAAMANALDDKVLLHEMMHIRRHDVFKNYIFLAFRCLHWFNPFLWRVFGHISDDCETACDECVLDLLNPDDQIAYGHCLLNMVQPKFQYRMGTSCIASGENNIRRRIVRVTRHKEISGEARKTGIVVFLLLGWMCLTAPAVQAMAWKGAGVPTQDVQSGLAKAARYCVSNVQEALYLYGKAFVLDNGYYRYIVADDGTRAQLEQQFLQNESPRVWHFDDAVLLHQFEVNYGEGQTEDALRQNRELTCSPYFGIYNIVQQTDGAYTAVVGYPVVKTEQLDAEGNIESYDYHYCYDHVQAEKQGKRWIVTSREQGREDLEERDRSPRDLGGLVTYLGEDENYEYKVVLTSGKRYIFPNYRYSTGEWEEQKEAMWSMMGWQDSGSLPATDGWDGFVYVRPKDPTARPVSTAYLFCNMPEKVDIERVIEGTGGSADSESFQTSDYVHINPADGIQPDEDGWYCQDSSLAWALGNWDKGMPELHLFTKAQGDAAERPLTVIETGGKKVPG